MRGMARTAVVAGTATAVSNRVSRRQANRWAAKEEPQEEAAAPPPAAPPPPPPPPAQPAASSQSDMLDALQKLGELKSAGVLTEAEFQYQKGRILAGG